MNLSRFPATLLFQTPKRKFPVAFEIRDHPHRGMTTMMWKP
jgi:hypothetical protein